MVRGWEAAEFFDGVPAGSIDVARGLAGSGRSLLEITAVLERAPVGFAVVDEHMRFLYANPEFVTVHGLATRDYVGRMMNEVIPPAYAAAVEPHVAEVLSTGAVHRDVKTRADIRNATKQRLLTCSRCAITMTR